MAGVGLGMLAEPAPAVDLFQEISNHITWLEEEICHVLADIRILESEMRAIRQRTELFLESYYVEVGALIQNLHRINSEIHSLEHKDLQKLPTAIGKSDAFEEPMLAEEGLEDIEQKELKALYRLLVKYCHPDSGRGKKGHSKKERFLKLQHAYEERDLAALIRIEQQVAQKPKKSFSETNIQKLERLEKELDSVTRRKTALELQKNKLMALPAYQLMQKIRWGKLCGRDVLKEIKYKITRQLAHSEENLLRLRHKLV